MYHLTVPPLFHFVTGFALSFLLSLHYINLNVHILFALAVRKTKIIFNLLHSTKNWSAGLRWVEHCNQAEHHFHENLLLFIGFCSYGCILCKIYVFQWFAIWLPNGVCLCVCTKLAMNGNHANKQNVNLLYIHGERASEFNKWHSVLGQ